MDSSPESLLLEDFGQKVDLTRRIREVLSNYPEGITVLKELIQNADDAGATKVCLCLDRRTHGTTSLLSNKLGQWQGPALLAYNNAEFNEEDFVSISRIGGSSKQGQAWKTGRFGVGFNSVYHITDLPSFVSGKYVVLFDPQGVFLPNISVANPGKRIEFASSSSAISLYKDQFIPYCAFGCDMKSPFPGTLFRFPLRNADQAAASKLSRQVYSEDDISSLFVQLYEEGVLTLLFLKNVLSIEMYTWDTGEPEPTKLYSCSVNSVNNDTVWHRQALLRLSKSFSPSSTEIDAFSLDFLRETLSGPHLEKKKDSYYIVQTMASTASRVASFAATASKDYAIHLLPWASVAACISDIPSDDDIDKDGRAFCFLPLPLRTGMHVHVNGYFEVSSNRRSIWYGEDMDRSGKMRSIWNKLLLEDVVAPIFTHLLLCLRELLGPTSSYYTLWPYGSFEEPWSFLVEKIYRNIGNDPVLYSYTGDGKWVSPLEAFLHDKEFAKSKDLGNALEYIGMPIVHLPNSLSDMLLKYSSGHCQNVVTPDAVRHFLRGCKRLQNLSRSHKLILLEYCLDDLIDADVGMHAYDLPLLPLANKDFGLFSEASKGISYFICNELELQLLERISDRVIDRDIPHNIFTRLSAIAECSKANLVFFSIQYFLHLFPRFVSADWKYRSKVYWDQESVDNHMTSSWFMLFWQYLHDQCDKLSLFGDWPILPSTSGYLHRASIQSKLISVEKLPQKIQVLLANVGCKILDRSYGVDHPDLSHYVCNADGAGVLESIFDVVSLNGGIVQTLFRDVGAEERDELRRFLLDPKWYIGNCMDDSTIWNCKRVPVYKVCDGQTFHFSDLLNPQKYLPPLDVAKSFLGGEFIISSSKNEEEVLLRYFGIERMGKTRFYRQQVFAKIRELQPDVRDSIMLSVLQDLPQLCNEDATFRECISNVEFVPTLSGVVKCPTMLYDPRIEELYALLGDADVFPCGVFEESSILDMLQGLGLKTFVSPETVIQSARQVERLMREDQQKSYSRGKVLLSYLEVNAMKWLPDPSTDNQGAVNRMFSRAATALRPRNSNSDLEKFWSDLRLICWCPVLVYAPFQTLPWPVVTSIIAPPKLVRLPSDLWLVSASMRILDAECSSTALSNQLGWSSPPGGSVIAAQLLELGKNNESVNDQVLRQELALAMPRLYSILASLIGSDEMDIVKAVLEGSRWIWVGDGFATSEEVVLNGPLHLAPYIRVIPVDLAVFRELFLELGIREFLKPVDYANILLRMATRKGTTPLDTLEIRAAVLIAQHLAEVQFDEHNAKIYLPDVSGRLLAASDLVYNDAPWLLGSEGSDSSFYDASSVALNAKRSIQKFVHGNISNDVAERLGVCSLRRTLLAESSDSMNLSLSGAAEAFGQHEALTTRLRHILEMYADGPGILFELVQNAEDAGASEVVLLLDKTQYGTSSVLSPEMADWQGPALYCFNDSIFSPQDLYAISRIGQESKLDKPFAIGRFGLGFNCVYHFTDIPTFVSGENIVMFDPHACNLPGISPSHPGLRIKFVGRRILEQFPDQFSPFLHFGCDLLHPFPGTLFRFPLRSASAASRSQIKREGYTPEDVTSLFSSFTQAVSEALLFLRNVKTISIYVKEGLTHEMQLLHRVRRNCIKEPEIDSSAWHHIFDFTNGNQQHGKVDMAQFLSKMKKSTDRDLPRKFQKIVVTEESSSEVMSHCWVTSECLNVGRAKNNSDASNNKSHYYIPWACVAAYLHSFKAGRNSSEISNGEDACLVSLDTFQGPCSLQIRKGFEGRAFCFLPLPVCTGFPAHINAYFELSSNRRDIWFGNDMAGGGKKRSDWNLHLLEDVAAPAYAYLLEKVALEKGPCDIFYSFWPTTTGSEPWASMARKVYNFVAVFGLRVLYTNARGGQWISATQAIFPDFTFRKAHELVEALSDAGFALVTVPESLAQIFMGVCPSLHYLTSQLLRNLLIRRKREFKDKNAVILTLEYCLLDLSFPDQSAHLYSLPLLPLANGLFTTFEKKGESERIYIARGDEYGLLKDSIPHQLVDCEVPEDIHRKLCDIAQSGETNLSFLTCNLLEKLFVRLLPVEWQNAKQITWVPGQHGQPTFEWMELLWSFLKLYCDDLSIFCKWPILPIQNQYLLQLAENSNVIKSDGWSENMLSLLLKVGCQFLRPDMPIEHLLLTKYVQPSSAAGILNAILAVAGKPENIEGLFVDALEGELQELRNFVLQSRWFSEDQMDDVHINIIEQIPMFESFRSRKQVRLCKPIKWLKPYGVRDDLLDDNFIRAESERERIILTQYLGIREPSRAEFYKEYVLNRMTDFLSNEEVLSAILHDMKLLVDGDRSVKDVLSMIPFVLAADGSWKQPSRLYDPRIPELQKVLHRDAFFPSGKFLDSETLETLVTLGLRRTLGFTGLLDCARSVSMFHDSGDPEALSCGRKLLFYLDALALKLSSEEKEAGCAELNTSNFHEESILIGCNTDNDNLVERDENGWENAWDMKLFIGELTEDKSEEEFWSEMKAITWCPVYPNSPLPGLPWLKDIDLVAPPNTVRPKGQMIMVSSSMHILDGECSEYLQSKLSWLSCPKTDVLSTQLMELSRSYAELKLNSVVEPEFDAALQEGIPLLYSKLQEYIGKDDFTGLRDALVDVSWVWIGDDFVSTNALAFDSPVKYSPYLFVVPSELSDFRDLLLELGVPPSFGIPDYIHVLQRLHKDVQGLPLSTDQLSFVHCVLEAVADCYSDKPLSEVSNTPPPLLIPDSLGILTCAGDLVYNDAPWMENNTPLGKALVHPSISNDLANRLGIQSLRCISLVDEEMAKDLPCMEYARINELLALYGNNDFLLYDLLQLADSCKARKLHLIFDKREHPRQSLLQHNLGEFQGPALIAILVGASLSREEITSLQLLPPWRLRGETLNYGLGLFSCYFICDLLSIVSGGHFYIFDPLGLALGVPSSDAPAAKVFSLMGTNLIDRFHDQFIPLIFGQNIPWSSMDSTVIRMPLSSQRVKNGLEDGLKRIKQINDRFLEHASKTLLFLKSVVQVSISTWEEGSQLPCEDYSVSVDSSSAVMRNPFSEKKWKKFQISRIFGSSNAASKLQVIDVNLNQKGTRVVDRWLVVLSLGSGQTRNMALDRKYLAYNLTPVAGVAAHISRDGHPANTYSSSSIMSPLPLSGCLNIPVTVLGCFLVCHNSGRYLFKYQDQEALAEAWHDAGNNLIEAWNRELMSCVRDSYIELVLEIEKLRREPLSSSSDSSLGRAVNLVLKAYGDQIYSFWPRSIGQNLSRDPNNGSVFIPKEASKADWECLIARVIRPFYIRVADLPLWQLYSGTSVKAEEGMFLSQPGSGMTANVLPATVCSFVKEHYPVFSVPWELVSEIQAVGLTVREIKPKMVRDLLRDSSTSIVLRSVDTYVDVLEYCLSDIQLLESSNASLAGAPMAAESTLRDGGGNNSISMTNTRGLRDTSVQGGPNAGGDALEIMTNLGKALFDFGRTVVEDIGRGGGGPLGQTNYIAVGNSSNQRYLSIAAELKRLPCPTATNHLTRLGVTELWCGNKDQQKLMSTLTAKFIHSTVMDRSILANILSNSILQTLLKLQNFSLPLLSNHMKLLFHNNWVNHVMVSGMSPWFSWENTTNSGGEGGPSPEWIRLFWRSFNGSLEDLSLFSDWPLVPAFLGRPVLCRVKERHLVFVPPPAVDPDSANGALEMGSEEMTELSMDDSVSESSRVYISAFKNVNDRYPWLLSLLNQCNIPVFDSAFIDCAAPCNCFPGPGQSLGQLIVSKLVSAKQAGYFPELNFFLASESDELFALFASDFSSNGSTYGREEVEVLRALPIFKTIVGSYTKLHNQDLCTVSSNSFLRPYDDRCLSCSINSVGSDLLRALGVPELHDQQILVKFGLPGYESKHQSEQEDILIYIYMNWQDLQVDSSVVDALKETRFVQNADEFSTDLFMPKDLFDPHDALLTSVFCGERKRFPGERFATDGWLQILRKAGLRTAIEPDVMLECARRVEFLGSECMKPMGDVDFETELSSSQNEVTGEIWSLAVSVVESVFSNFAVLYSNNFCNLFGKIACIPAEKGFPGAGGKIGGKKVLASYSEAVLWKDWPLAWSCIPILSRQCVPPEYSWGALHLKSPPVFSTVLKHLQVIGRNNGEDTLAHWPNASGMRTIDESSCEILTYLDKIWGSLSASDISELQRLAFMPAANGTRLVTANSLFARLTINLSPFAFELPIIYLPFMKILKDLGLQETLTVACAKGILLTLQKACGYQRLNPNELRAVMEILFFVCDTTVETNASDLSSWGSEAVVPDDGGRLVHTVACVYIDSYGSQFVKFINTSRLRFVHPDLPERICTALSIKKLSDVVVEEVEDIEQLQTLQHIGSIPVAAIRKKLLSRSLQAAVWTLINSLGSCIPALKNLSLKDIQSSLKYIAEKLQFVQRLHTCFLLLPMSMNITLMKESLIPEWGSENHHRVLYFVSQSKTIMLVAEPPSYISVLDVIASVVSHVFGSPTPLPIASLFLCPEDSESAVIDVLKLCSEKKESEQLGPNCNPIGKELMPQDAVQIQFHPLRPFYAGEVIAWCSQNGEKLKYGRVPEDVRPSAGQALYRFKVETAPGLFENLLSSQVFSFRSLSMGSDSSQATLLEGNHTVAENKLLADVPESSSKYNARSQLQPGNDLQYGRVSAGELLQAVHEMLSTAGISMDVEKQSLLQTTLTLQEQLKESQAALLLEQEKADTASKEAETARSAWTCRVCLSAEVDMTLVPCGHVLCRRCSSAVSKCPFCRIQVSKTLKIYRP